MPQEQQVMVRQAVRHDVYIRGTIAIAEEHASAVRFSANSGAKDGWLDVDVLDFSSGGIGFISTVFVPRKTLLYIRLFAPNVPRPPILSATLRVQRVLMTDRRPAYLAGTSIEAPTPETSAQVAHLLRVLDGEETLKVA